MASSLVAAPALAGGPQGPRRRKRSPLTFGRVLVVVGGLLAIALVWMMAGRVTVSERPNDMKTTAVILPPPPPPPPPPETKPIEKPPEPTIAPPIEQPVDTPPPPQANNEPAPGDSALTAREGAGPSNYGLARGDGSGTKIGGRVGGGAGIGFAAYASSILPILTRAAQQETLLARSSFRALVRVEVAADGRVTGVTIVNGTGDTRKDEALRRRLAGVQLPAPPPGLPSMRIEVSSS